MRRQTSVGAVATDVRYADSAPEGWREPLLDVYAPSGAKDLPLVVLFHGAPTAVDKTGSGLVDYPALAEEIASRGAVVVSANWGLYDAPMPADAQAFVDLGGTGSRRDGVRDLVRRRPCCGTGVRTRSAWWSSATRVARPR